MDDNEATKLLASLFEMGARVPLMISRARKANGNGHASTRIVESLDVPPTLV